MTTSLELSKALYDKGLKIETEKWWNNLNSWQVVSKFCNDDILWRNEGRGIKIENYPAYSTDELLAVLPDWYKIRKANNKYYCMADGLDPEEHPMITEDINPAEALGLMCFWLLDNGYHFNGKELRRIC